MKFEALSLLLSSLLFIVHAAPSDLDTTCPLTFLPGNSCNITGSVQTPDVLKVVQASSETSCAEACTAYPKCRSIRYVDTTQRCYIYSKYLENMNTDRYAAKPGYLFDSNCFSTDCKRISACNKASKCFRISQGAFSYSYEQSACSYGHVARPFKMYPSRTYTYDGKTVPTHCCAIQLCASHFVPGVFDVHFDKPTGNWTCIRYENNPEYSYAPADQGASPGRYTVPDRTVGAGYGYILTNIENTDRHNFCPASAFPPHS